MDITKVDTSKKTTFKIPEIRFVFDIVSMPSGYYNLYCKEKDIYLFKDDFLTIQKKAGDMIITTQLHEGKLITVHHMVDGILYTYGKEIERKEGIASCSYIFEDEETKEEEKERIMIHYNMGFEAPSWAKRRYPEFKLG